ncbi:MAG: hypothetical protein IT210_14745 [Armatimonadetes bacterium]|nr:hypothetical protein [Armatimonadota bacterium]
MEYNRYMTRRLWAKTLASAAEAGYTIRFVGSPAEAKGSAGMFILGETLSPAELAEVKRADVRLWILPNSALQKDLPEAAALAGEKL